MSRRVWVLLLVAFAVGSVATTVYLLRRPPPASLANLETPSLRVGTQLEDITGRNEKADVVRVQLRGTDRPTMLYIVTPACSWCTRNRRNFAEIVRQRSGEYHIEFISLSEGGFSGYLHQLRPDWNDEHVTTLTSLPARTKAEMLLGPTPQTIIIDRDGKVTHNWVGAYTSNTLIAVENLFLLQMPGLVEDPPRR